MAKGEPERDDGCAEPTATVASNSATSKKSILQRGHAFIKETLVVLLSTPTTLQDKAFVDAALVFPGWVLMTFGILKRVLFVIAFAYFVVVNFVDLRYTNKFVSLDESAGICSPVPRPWTSSSIKGTAEAKHGTTSTARPAAVSDRRALASTRSTVHFYLLSKFSF
jgi:hypothetical protein